MLGRSFWGAGASAVFAGTMASNVAHAAVIKKPQGGEETSTFAPVYDNEVPKGKDPLPGTIEASTHTEKTELAHAETELAKKLEIEDLEAEGRVFRVSKLLEPYLGSVRHHVDAALGRASSTTSEISQKYRESERQAVTTVASLRSENEEMLPASIYVLVSGLGGSIVARRHNILVRATLPWSFGGAAFAYFSPETWTNVRQLAWKYEQEQVPTIAKKHEETAQNLASSKTQTVQSYDDGEKNVKSKSKSVRKSIKDWTGF